MAFRKERYLGVGSLEVPLSSKKLKDGDRVTPLDNTFFHFSAETATEELIVESDELVGDFITSLGDLAHYLESGFSRAVPRIRRVVTDEELEKGVVDSERIYNPSVILYQRVRKTQ